VLDHFLVDFIGTLRRSFDEALLVRQAVEERFQVDVFLGDLSWETSYSLPGEEQPARVRADLSLDWPTWSQTAYRSWSIGETPAELPEVVVEVALRVQRLASQPKADEVLAVIPSTAPLGGADLLERSAVTIEETHAGSADGADGAGETGEPLDAPEPPVRWAIEATYEGSLRFDEETLDQPSACRPTLQALSRWVASTLVRLADLPFAFHPPDAGGDQ